MEAFLKIFALVNELSATLPAAVAAVKGALSEDEEAKLKQALVDLRAKNDANYETVIASLKSKA